MLHVVNTRYSSFLRRFFPLSLNLLFLTIHLVAEEFVFSCSCRAYINSLLSSPIATFKLFMRCSFIVVPYVTHLDETSHMSTEFVFRYVPKCMGGLIVILPILVLLHL